jgi:hypothetical protein
MRGSAEQDALPAPFERKNEGEAALTEIGCMMRTPLELQSYETSLPVGEAVGVTFVNKFEINSARVEDAMGFLIWKPIRNALACPLLCWYPVAQPMRLHKQDCRV